MQAAIHSDKKTSPSRDTEIYSGAQKLVCKAPTFLTPNVKNSGPTMKYEGLQAKLLCFSTPEQPSQSAQIYCDNHFGNVVDHLALACKSDHPTQADSPHAAAQKIDTTTCSQ